jgi:hypothetical protein
VELRLDRLLNDFRLREADILAAIDSDPLLLQRSNRELVLANASKKLFSPQEPHQLLAKGIIYQRNPYRLVSLPLVKIFNVGERNITTADLSGLLAEPEIRLRYLRKMDGTLIQVFRHGRQIYFTTRGMIEGASPLGERDEDELPHFDYLGEARKLAQRLYPEVFSLPEGLTLLFELIHPGARKITHYGDRVELVLLAAFDRENYRYADYDEMSELAHRYRLTIVDFFSPLGEDLPSQVESLVQSLHGTDEEGSVLSFERPGQVVYRVKVKTPDYLQLMRMMAFCTYDRTVEWIDCHAITSWQQLEEVLQSQGKAQVPEELLGTYRQYWERFVAYLSDLQRIGQWAEAQRDAIDCIVGGSAGKDPATYRRLFAREAARRTHPGLIFAALDGKLDVARMRKRIPTPEEAAALP